ncbi:branched-chain amino acid ABC transporter permease [Acuticoccus sediminis]|uniref:Branched-chain amino acid ABC transporter permease n=1 Tax=Acuticoccus sediminis TaxID=2184697 RepID=A0A8B2NSH6_9HYPH|nr:branched-chain amino acid ABC transporter permease [Acuticoccus sediminis]RAH99229.1 branched-chain amino acid ABC transporter permease [Acuticoccus sediminis]
MMRILFPAILAALAVYPFVGTSYVPLLTIVFAKALPVLGIILLLQAGQVSFGHALFFAVGAYTMGFVLRDVGAVDLVLLLPLATLAAGVAGLAVGVFVVRYRYIFFAMLNLAFSMVLYSLLEKFFHITGGTDGLRVARPTVLGLAMDRAEFELVLYGVSLALLAAALAAVHRLLDSPIGHTLKAIKTNETRVEYLGVSPRRTLLAFYVISAMLAGLGGALVAVFQGLATPDYAYWTRSGEMVFVAILGGAGNVLGALVGSFAFEFIRSFAAAYVGDYWQMTLGVVLLVIILFQPDGLIGLVQRLGRRPGRGRAGAAGERGRSERNAMERV